MLKVFQDFIKELFQINDYWGLFASFAKLHFFFAIVIAAAVILFVADFIVEQSRELHQRFNVLMKKTRGRVFIVVSVAISVLISYQLVAGLNAVRPVITPPSFAIGAPLSLEWQFSADKGEVGYHVLRAKDQMFRVEPYMYSFEPNGNGNYHEFSKINDTLWWKVRAISLSSNGKVVPVSEWSNPVQASQYDSVVERIRRTNTVKVYLSDENNLSFFKFFALDGHQDGFDPRLAHLVVEKLQDKLQSRMPLRFDPRHANWNKLLEMPEEADFIISAITKTPERESKLAFSSTYFSTTLSLIHLRSVQVRSIREAIQGKRIGVEEDTTGEKMIDKLISELNIVHSVTIIRTKQTSKAITALKNNEVDFVVADTPFAVGEEELNSTGQLSHEEFNAGDLPANWPLKEEYAIGVRRGDPLGEYINEILKTIAGTGELCELAHTVSTKYFRKDVPLPGEAGGGCHSSNTKEAMLLK